jgi:hypothetical protein
LIASRRPTNRKYGSPPGREIQDQELAKLGHASLIDLLPFLDNQAA